MCGAYSKAQYVAGKFAVVAWCTGIIAVYAADDALSAVFSAWIAADCARLAVMVTVSAI
jgi:hypothetical protein